MTESASVFEIPHLLDRICANLDRKDLWNCARCCRDWNSYFGPYLFHSITLSNLTRPKTFRVYNNHSHHIRTLSFAFSNFERFDISHCNKLRELEVQFGGRDIEFEHVQDDPNTIPEARIRVADLIQKNHNLRTLRIREKHGLPRVMRYLVQPILDAIKNHHFLTTIIVSVPPACYSLPTFIAHLPPQLLELDMGSYVIQNCYGTSKDHIREFHIPKLRLRRLILSWPPRCFIASMFLPLLRQCPDLEVLQLPFQLCNDKRVYDAVKLAHVFETHCERLHTLMVQHCAPKCRASVDLVKLVQAFPKEFRGLYLCNYRCCEFQGDYLDVVQWFPWLQEFGMDCSRKIYKKGIDTLEIIKAMDQPWKCWNGLETLRLYVINKDTPEDEVIRRTYRLFLKLRSLPKLRVLAIQWGEDTPKMSLAMLNRVAKEKESPLMTERDAKWMELPMVDTPLD
ncbi:hypothetical protein B0O80DRAFT_529549 [Mortierella sp. GBAus27b]|nr:hypothetical protein BGX31_005471 [Mortierella sp. GBA43]KAI8353394.1 hypothetical protein B0O80DRAFT_529549 [Mortierella sp. GBAus27b]